MALTTQWGTQNTAEIQKRREVPYFSSSTGGLLMRVIRLQYQIMMMRILGVRNVFMANHTLVKPPFWWML